jgi:hypothetical protein
MIAPREQERNAAHPGLQRLDHGRPGIPVTLFVFDVLAVEGLCTTMQP